MTLKRILPLALAMATSMPVLSQVQLFEAEVSGLVPYATYRWNQGIQEYGAGIEYNIDGRTSLAFAYSRPVEDSLSFDTNLKSYTINPYAIFEFIEPDNLKTFSFAIRTDFIHEETSPKDKVAKLAPGSSRADTIAYATQLNSFSRTQIGGGPVFALRIFSSDRLVLVPMVGYEVFYVTSKKADFDPTKPGTAGYFPSKNYLWHDLVGSCPFHFMLNEFNGITVEPKVIVKFGPGHAAKDLLNLSLTAGYVRSF